MYLNEVFKSAPKVLIEQLSCDSRIEMKNAIFFCVPGVKYDGHNFVEEAIKNGAKVIIYDQEIDRSLNAIYIKVHDTLQVLNKIAPLFYGHPANKMENYIISGCYNKRSASYVLKNVLRKYMNTASIDSFGIEYANKSILNINRTLPIIENQMYMKNMIDAGDYSCVFESSVLDLSYEKLDSVNPKYFIYTTTGIESRQYKELGRSYLDELVKYIGRLNPNTKLVLNSDDYYFEEIVEACKGSYISYGFSDNDDVVIKNVKYFDDHTNIKIVYKNKLYTIETKLLGFAAVNAVCAAFATLVNDYPVEEIITYIKDIKRIKGIYEKIDLGQDYNVFVDAADNSENIESIIKWAKLITNGKNKIITILSFNHQVSESKLLEIMDIVKSNSSRVILTTGDTYNNDVNQLNKIAVNSDESGNVIVVDEREVAIEMGIELLNKNDTLLILSKGDDRVLNLSLGKVPYQGDNNIAKKYIEKRTKEEHELC